MPLPHRFNIHIGFPSPYHSLNILLPHRLYSLTSLFIPLIAFPFHYHNLSILLQQTPFHNHIIFFPYQLDCFTYHPHTLPIALSYRFFNSSNRLSIFLPQRFSILFHKDLLFPYHKDFPFSFHRDLLFPYHIDFPSPSSSALPARKERSLRSSFSCSWNLNERETHHFTIPSSNHLSSISVIIIIKLCIYKLSTSFTLMLNWL